MITTSTWKVGLWTGAYSCFSYHYSCSGHSTTISATINTCANSSRGTMEPTLQPAQTIYIKARRSAHQLLLSAYGGGCKPSSLLHHPLRRPWTYTQLQFLFRLSTADAIHQQGRPLQSSWLENQAFCTGLLQPGLSARVTRVRDKSTSWLLKICRSVPSICLSTPLNTGLVGFR